jgi:hypothetical protein
MHIVIISQAAIAAAVRYKAQAVLDCRVTGIPGSNMFRDIYVCSSCFALYKLVYYFFDVELRLSPRWVGGNIGSTDATKTCHTLNAYIFETNNRKLINNTSLDNL